MFARLEKEPTLPAGRVLVVPTPDVTGHPVSPSACSCSCSECGKGSHQACHKGCAPGNHGHLETLFGSLQCLGCGCEAGHCGRCDCCLGLGVR